MGAPFQALLMVGGGDPASGGYITPFYPTSLYSLRKRTGSYAGKCIRIKRSSDSTQLDIGFASDGWMDVSALTTFVGAGDGFVKTWYDQAGSADITDSTSADSIKLVSAGVVNTSNSRPMMPWNSATPSALSIGANAAFAFGTNAAFTWEIFSKPSATTSGVGQVMLDWRDSGSAIALFYNGGGSIPTVFDGANNGPGAGTLTNNTFVHLAAAYVGGAGGTLRIFQDGSGIFATGKSFTFVGNRPFIVGNGFNNSLPWSGGIVEIRITRGVCEYTAAFTPPDYYA